LASDPVNHQVVYLGGVDSFYTSRGAVIRSTDGGINWADISPSSTTWKNNVSDVNDIVVGSNPKLYAATNYGLWIWDGADWEHMSNLTSDDNITALAIDRSTDPNTIYMGSGGDGVFYSDDGGMSWSALNEGLENLNITKLALSKTQPKMLYAGTAYGGVWSISLVKTYTISGKVSTAESSIKIQAAGGLSGVVMGGLPGNPTTDASGNYSGTVDYRWSGTVTPSKAGYSFNPSSRTYSNVTSDQLDQNYTASIIKYTLTISAGSGGTTEPAAGSYTYDSGTQVSVRAIPNSGYQFSGWSGDASGTTNPITITMDSNKSITANFSKTDGGGDTEGDGDSGKKSPCFIATAAYGSPLHPHLDVLRDFRDKYLIPTKVGRAFVNLYYKYSPFAADLIAKHKALKVVVRVSLLPLVAFSYSLLHFGPIITAVMPLFIFGLPIFLTLFFRRKMRQKKKRKGGELS
jgi:uncharacterized repeat protein (TIGR02543 family)